MRFYQNRKLRYEPIGKNATEAETQRRRLERQTTIKAEAKKAGVVVLDTGNRKTLPATAAAYISDAEDRGANEAAVQARLVTEEFRRAVKKTYIDELTREDILRFIKALRKGGNADRTVSNKFKRMKSWLLFAGLDRETFPPEPKYEKKLPTTYTRDEISGILGAADDYMSLAIGLALKCGLREQEIAFAIWSDIDEHTKTFRVRSKKLEDVYSSERAKQIRREREEQAEETGKPIDTVYAFKVKDSEQRDLPIPDGLLEDLKSWRAGHKGARLILGNKKDEPERHLLRKLKQTARRGGLNCGHCSGCAQKNRECYRWELHEFRRTYGTTLLRNGMDIRTVQALMGHADLGSTLRYLQPAAAPEIREKLNGIDW